MKQIGQFKLLVFTEVIVEASLLSSRGFSQEFPENLKPSPDVHFPRSVVQEHWKSSKGSDTFMFDSSTVLQQNQGICLIFCFSLITVYGLREQRSPLADNSYPLYEDPPLLTKVGWSDLIFSSKRIFPFQDYVWNVTIRWSLCHIQDTLISSGRVSYSSTRDTVYLNLCRQCTIQIETISIKIILV